MKFYCGTDIIEVERVKKSILSTPRFKERIFSPLEIDYAESKSDVTKYQHYAGRFAAKEAIYKSLSNVTSNLQLSQIEIINDPQNNRPTVVLHNDLLHEMMKCENLTVDVSISHIKDYACANAIAVFNK